MNTLIGFFLVTDKIRDTLDVKRTQTNRETYFPRTEVPFCVSKIITVHNY